MALKLGSTNRLMISAWTKTMLVRYPSYALGTNGLPIKVDGYFGYDEEKVQKEYQRRTNQPQTGVVSDGDLHYLGLLPTLFSIHGTGQADPFGIGYPADIARRLLDVYWWQPVGDWPASAVPMNHSVDKGVAETVRLLNDRNVCPGPNAFVDYSQGSCIGGRVRERMRKGEFPGKTLIGSASFGNPMRPADSYAGNVNPGGHGIDPFLESVTAPQFLNLAAKGDLYTTCPDGDTGEMERAIFNMVFSRFTGKDSILEQLWELFTNPTKEIPAALTAIINGGMFVFRGLGPHTRYHVDLCPGTGVTYYEHAINHLRDVATARLQRIVSAP